MSTITVSEDGVRRQRVKTIVGTGVGNAMEWYDWNVYATFSVFFSTQVFDAEHPTSAFLATMAIFTVGFVARPLGGFLFGWFADRVGRKASMMWAVVFASVGSLLIAICPTHSQAGVFSAVILVLARIIQGLAHGGELPSAQTYLSEQAPRERRGLWASSIYVSGTLGIVFGMVLGLILNLALTSEQMNAWGWRLPFALGAVLGLFALWLRTQLEESETFEEAKADDSSAIVKDSIWTSLRRHWKESLQVVGMTAGLTCIYYIWSVSTPAYAIKNLHFDANSAFWAAIIGNLFLIAMCPVWGWVSDKIGRKPLLITCFAGCLLLYLPMTWMIHDEMWQLLLAIVVMLFFISMFTAIGPAVYAEMFPTDVRATGMGLPYAVAIAAFGGTAPLLIAYWAETPLTFQLYAMVLLAISLATVLTLPETRAKDLSSEAAA